MRGEAADSCRGFRTSIRTLSRENFFSLMDATTMPAKDRDTPERHLNFGGCPFHIAAARPVRRRALWNAKRGSVPELRQFTSGFAVLEGPTSR